MKLSERIRKERFMGGCGERAGEWADEVAKLEEKNGALKQQRELEAVLSGLLQDENAKLKRENKQMKGTINLWRQGE